jgi:hypothetical protein
MKCYGMRIDYFRDMESARTYFGISDAIMPKHSNERQ